MTLIKKLEEIKQQALYGDLNDVDKVEHIFDDCIKLASELQCKAQKYDELDNEISRFYPADGIVDDEEDGGLISIGEICAMKLGYI